MKQFREALLKKYDVDCGLAMIVKQRAKANEIERMDLVGNVENCDVVIGKCCRWMVVVIVMSQ